MSKVIGYVASGSVRGDCGHLHKTPEAAEQCRAKDARGCTALSKHSGYTHCYSDRSVYAVLHDGTRRVAQCEDGE